MSSNVDSSRHTVADLLQVLSDTEAFRQRASELGKSSQAAGPAIEGSLAAAYLIQSSYWSGLINEKWDETSDMVGMDRFKTACIARSGQFNAQAFRQLCACIALENSLSYDAFLELELQEGAKLVERAMRPREGGPPRQANTISRNNDANAPEQNPEDNQERATQVVQPFLGGEIVFFPDRVELCGADICSGRRCQTKRTLLELLRVKQSDGSYAAYSSEQLAEALGQKSLPGRVTGAIRDLRDNIVEALRVHANLRSGRHDVILSGGRGYRFAENITVHSSDEAKTTGITDMDESGGVPNVRNDHSHHVRNVRDRASINRRAWILRHLEGGHQLRAPAVAKHFKCSVKTAQRDLSALNQEGKIEFMGSPRTGTYRLRRPSKTSE
jgi:hypothetical protein